MTDPPGTQWLRAARMRMQNLRAAMHELNLTPQEQYAYEHHLGNLDRGGVRHDNGSISSFLNTIRGFDTGQGERYYILPTVWDNQILPEDEAVQRAHADGLHKWPSYPTVEAAQSRYDAMHSYMERDTNAYR